MPYDLDILNEYCREIGLPARITDRSALKVFLGNGAVLSFQNSEREQDCLVGFVDMPWHTHGDLMFADPRGHNIELDPLNLLSCLKAGTVLVCEQRLDGLLTDRWLTHSEYNNEFQYLGPGEEITVRRAILPSADSGGLGG